MKGKCPVVEENGCAGKAPTNTASKTSSEPPLPLPWVLPTLRYRWYSHHIGSPVSNQGRFCWLTNTASAQLHFHPSYPGGGGWVQATRHPCYRAAMCGRREAGRKAEAPLRDGFHHRQSFTQPRLFLTRGVESVKLFSTPTGDGYVPSVPLCETSHNLQ